jgi:hypothetical protein
MFTVFHVTSKLEIEFSNRQLLGDWAGKLQSQQEKRGIVFFNTWNGSPGEIRILGSEECEF